MKKIIFAIVAFFAIATNVFANGYCDTRGSAQAVNQCYVSNIQTVNALVNRHYQMLAGSGKYSQQQKANLELNQLQWEEKVRQQCRDNPCVYESYVNRNRALVAEVYRVGADK